MATLTVYPDPSSGGTTVDGFITSGYGGSMAIAHAITNGDGANPISPYTPKAMYVRTLHNGTGYYLGRLFFTFDTSALTALATISSAVISLFGDSFSYANSDSSTMEIVASNPASSNNLATTDFGNISFTSFASLAIGSMSQSAYNDFTLNAGGIANISKTGISKFGAVTGLDLNQTSIGSAPNDNIFSVLEADTAGTANDPKLTITYSLGGTLPKSIIGSTRAVKRASFY